MPRISEFYGIAIYMYFRDHAPPLVKDWANAHRDELQENWNRARQSQQLNAIEPLT